MALIKILLEGGEDQVGQALAAICGRGSEGGPATRHELVISRLEAGGGGDAAIGMPGTAFEIARSIEREEHFLAELRAFGQHSFDKIGGGGRKTGEVGVAIDANTESMR